MDYPPPMVKLDGNGNIDLSNAYTNNIGDWDKVSITWGYQDFVKGTDENKMLDKILRDATGKGYKFISDRDARPPGGLHPQAHLWDNGTSAADELKVAIQVRAKALSQFGEKDIRPGMPMAMLEDVLVPVYLYHRYQLEAATKVVGGMYYSYAIRGDGQVVTKAVSKEEQQKALDAIIECIDPTFLMLPAPVIKLIPPRPQGYDFTRELFKKRTGLAFDALAPAETGADFPFSFLFNSERLNRMSQYEVEDGGLGERDMLNTLITKTWKSPRRTGMEKLIQLQTEQILLTYLLAVSTDENASFQVKAIAQQAVQELKTYIETLHKTTKDPTYAAHLAFALERIKTPEKAKPTAQHREIPPGAPIGCDWDE